MIDSCYLNDWLTATIFRHTFVILLDKRLSAAAILGYASQNKKLSIRPNYLGLKFTLNKPSRHLTSVGRQIDVRLRRHNDVGFRLILKVCLTSKTDVILTSKPDVILTSKTDVILTSEKQRWFDVSNVTS